MERSAWVRAFGGGDLRKWPVGCRMGGSWFVLGVHGRMTRPGPDVWGELGGRAAGNGQRCRRIGALFVRASVGVGALIWANIVRWRLKRNRGGLSIFFRAIYAFSVEWLFARMNSYRGPLPRGRKDCSIEVTKSVSRTTHFDVKRLYLRG
jgi:hypothetical protein